MPDDDDAWLRTLGLIRLFQRAVSLTVSLLRQTYKSPDIAAAVRNGTIDRRGLLFNFLHYRVQGDRIVATATNIRIEIEYAHPDAFSGYLLQRHISLNRKLARSFPQYVGIPLPAGLKQLEERGLICAVDPDATLFKLTQAGVECAESLGLHPTR